MDRNFRLRLPAPITNDAGYTLKKASNNAPAAHSELYAKLCKLQHISRQTSTSKESKRMQRRTDFVLSYQAKEEGASTSLLAPFKQTIDLSLKDSYVSFGTNHVNAGQLAGAKTTALVLTEDQRKAVEAGAPGEQRQEIGAKPGRNALKKAKKIEREKTKGDAWYGLPAPEMTDEIKRDLEVLQMRGALDPKRFYKKNDTKELPKYFQVRIKLSTVLMTIALFPLFVDGSICGCTSRFLLGKADEKGKEENTCRRIIGGCRIPAL
jgi:hypothetical protein